MDLSSPSALSVPKDFHDVTHVHLCPFDFASQSQMVNLFKNASSQTVTLDPDSRYMSPRFWRELRLVLQGVTAFHPSEEEMRSLFWGETNDLWDMAKHISDYGVKFVVIKRGSQVQILYDAISKKKYEIPAYPSRVADPTGAGDAFCGGFLAGFQKTQDPLQAVLYGSASASLKVEGSGPFYPLDVMPGLAEARLHALKEMAREV
jgi:sugar/nucleoside kinase (ribokinase family)